MPKAAIIVESPTKTRTLGGFLGRDYLLLASMGHVRDLPEDDLAVDVEHSFEPHYVTIPRQRKTISRLKKELQDIDEIYLASDPDREGEAIAWHLAQVLGLPHPKRIEFNEITKEAVLAALQQPREIDLKRVDAQQARRVLDRLVGYEISPLLWRRIGGSRGGASLSAGRVQSAALHLICSREREIAAFTPDEYWSLEVVLAPRHQDEQFKAAVRTRDGANLDLKSEEQARPAAAELEQLAYVVQAVEEKARTRNAQPPFITSTLQRQAANELRFSARKTMLVAEQLYQGVKVGEETVGLITYMRTDSTRVADQAVRQARGYIGKEFGQDHIGPGVRGKTAKGAQEAHEAIRPTSVTRTPDEMRPYLDKDQAALYELIWRRFLASQMAPARYKQIAVEITAGPYGLRATGSLLAFPGFLAVMPEKSDEAEARVLGTLRADQPLDLVQVLPEQHFTKPPPRYTEATLVQELEENGIGRPSTYAAIIETLRQRKYVRMRERAFVPTPAGFAVNDYLLDYFPHIMDIEFTARVEEDLDEVEEGRQDWVDLLHRYYDDLEAHLTEAKSATPRVLEGEVCPKCGGRLLQRYSVRGKFAGCENYPDCDYVRDLTPAVEGRAEPEPVGRDCPECGEPLVYREGWRGKKFVACTGFPKCRYTEQIDADGNAHPRAKPQTTDIVCDKCGAAMVIRESKRGKFLGCSSFPRCRNIMPIERLEGASSEPAEKEAAPAPKKSAAKRKSKGTAVKSQPQTTAHTPPDVTKPPGPEAAAEKPAATGETVNLVCDDCGSPMVVRRGSRGPFVACSAYPRCKSTKPIQAAYEAGYQRPEPQRLEEACPECGKPLVVRESRRGQFIGCSGYPHCRYTRPMAGESK